MGSRELLRAARRARASGVSSQSVARVRHAAERSGAALIIGRPDSAVRLDDRSQIGGRTDRGRSGKLRLDKIQLASARLASRLSGRRSWPRRRPRTASTATKLGSAAASCRSSQRRRGRRPRRRYARASPSSAAHQAFGNPIELAGVELLHTTRMTLRPRGSAAGARLPRTTGRG
jgi:hypothetical protein